MHESGRRSKNHACVSVLTNSDIELSWEQREIPSLYTWRLLLLSPFMLEGFSERSECWTRDGRKWIPGPPAKINSFCHLLLAPSLDPDTQKETTFEMRRRRRPTDAKALPSLALIVSLALSDFFRSNCGSYSKTGKIWCTRTKGPSPNSEEYYVPLRTRTLPFLKASSLPF